MTESQRKRSEFRAFISWAAKKYGYSPKQVARMSLIRKKAEAAYKTARIRWSGNK